jgi:hypothetical protein
MRARYGKFFRLMMRKPRLNTTGMMMKSELENYIACKPSYMYIVWVPVMV